MGRKNKRKKDDYTLAWTNPTPGEIKPKYAVHNVKKNNNETNLSTITDGASNSFPC